MKYVNKRNRYILNMVICNKKQMVFNLTTFVYNLLILITFESIYFNIPSPLPICLYVCTQLIINFYLFGIFFYYILHLYLISFNIFFNKNLPHCRFLSGNRKYYLIFCVHCSTNVCLIKFNIYLHTR